MSEIPTFVHDLFPISAEAVMHGFDYDFTRQSPFDDLIISLTADDRALIGSLHRRFDRNLHAVISRIDPDSGSLKSQEWTTNPLRIATLHRYTQGIAIGFNTLSFEAANRSGMLPVISFKTYQAWDHDETEKEQKDGQFYSVLAQSLDLGNIIADRFFGGVLPEEIANAIQNIPANSEIDKLKHTILRNELMARINSISRFNRYGNGRIAAFLRSEPAIEAAMTNFKDPDEDMPYTFMPQIAKGLFNIYSIFKAHHEVEELKTTLGS